MGAPPRSRAASTPLGVRGWPRGARGAQGEPPLSCPNAARPGDPPAGWEPRGDGGSPQHSACPRGLTQPKQQPQKNFLVAVPRARRMAQEASPLRCISPGMTPTLSTLCPFLWPPSTDSAQAGHGFTLSFIPAPAGACPHSCPPPKTRRDTAALPSSGVGTPLAATLTFSPLLLKTPFGNRNFAKETPSKANSSGG